MQDKRVAWFDLDLSAKPYRIMHYHTDDVTRVAFHPRFPLFASSSNDGSVHVFHGQVYQVSCRHSRESCTAWCFSWQAEQQAWTSLVHTIQGLLTCMHASPRTRTCTHAHAHTHACAHACMHAHTAGKPLGE